MRQVVVVKPPQEKEERRTEVNPNRVRYNPYAYNIDEKRNIKRIRLGIQYSGIQYID